jgi:hypothetical protein
MVYFFQPQKIVSSLLDEFDIELGIMNDRVRLFENLNQKQKESLYILNQIYINPDRYHSVEKITIVESLIVKFASILDIAKLIYANAYMDILCKIDNEKYKSEKRRYTKKNGKREEIDYMDLCRRHISQLNKSSNLKFLENNKDFFINLRMIRNRIVHGGANILIYEMDGFHFNILDFKKDSYIDYSYIYYNDINHSMLTIKGFNFFLYYFSIINLYCLDLFKLLSEKFNKEPILDIKKSIEVDYKWGGGENKLTLDSYQYVLKLAESYKERLHDVKDDLTRVIAELPGQTLQTDVKENYQEIIIKSICDLFGFTHNVYTDKRVVAKILIDKNYSQNGSDFEKKLLNNHLHLSSRSCDSERKYIYYEFILVPLVNSYQIG